MKLTIPSLVFTVFLLWVTIQIESVYEDYFAYVFVLTIGIMHGANDFALINYITKGSRHSKFRYYSIYVAIIILMSFTFFQFPFFALFIFVLFSCYHFGEQHFAAQLKQQHLWGKILFFSYGALIFALIFYLNLEDTISIIFELTAIKLLQVYFWYFLIFCGILTLVSVYFNQKNFKEGFNYFQEVFLLIVFSLLFKLASLLWAFAIYFVIWHSIPSLMDQIQALHGTVTTSSFLKYVKSSILYWTASIIGLALIYYLSTLFEIRFITLFFAFLAAITLPHVVVMYYLNKK